MPVTVFTHSSCLKHDPGPDHPETPARLRAILERLRTDQNTAVREAEPAGLDPLLAVHPQAYLASLEAMSARGGGALFLDTILSRDSWAAVLGATGAVLAAVEHALGTGAHAFAAVRPPGHHALAARGMGFCLVNNVVVAATMADHKSPMYSAGGLPGPRGTLKTLPTPLSSAAPVPGYQGCWCSET